MLKQLYLKVGQCLILVTNDRTYTEGQDFREGLVLTRIHRYGLVARNPSSLCVLGILPIPTSDELCVKAACEK